MCASLSEAQFFCKEIIGFTAIRARLSFVFGILFSNLSFDFALLILVCIMILFFPNFSLIFSCFPFLLRFPLFSSHFSTFLA